MVDCRIIHFGKNPSRGGIPLIDKIFINKFNFIFGIIFLVWLIYIILFFFIMVIIEIVIVV